MKNLYFPKLSKQFWHALAVINAVFLVLFFFGLLQVQKQQIAVAPVYAAVNETPETHPEQIAAGVSGYTVSNVVNVASNGVSTDQQIRAQISDKVKAGEANLKNLYGDSNPNVAPLYLQRNNLSAQSQVIVDSTAEWVGRCDYRFDPPGCGPAGNPFKTGAEAQAAHDTMLAQQKAIVAQIAIVNKAIQSARSQNTASLAMATKNLESQICDNTPTLVTKDYQDYCHSLF